MSTTEEQVLVVPARSIRQEFEGFTSDLSNLPAIYDLEFRPREAMEKDPSFKQLIPYVLINHLDESGQLYVFAYTRGGSGGEKRLHAKRSIGIGGHISREDAEHCEGLESLSRGPYMNGMHRELSEEVLIAGDFTEETVGMLYDPSNDVGKVHLGIVHFAMVSSLDVKSREDDLADAGFIALDEALANIEQFETWSQLCLLKLYYNPKLLSRCLDKGSSELERLKASHGVS